MRSLLITLLAIAFSCIVVAADYSDKELVGPVLSVGGRADGKDFWFHISSEVLKKTPAWMPTSPCPPLEPRRAIEIATKQLHGLVKDPSLWSFSSLGLVPFKADQWVYTVAFQRHYPENVSSQGGDWFALPVLMNGSTIEPKVRLLPPDVIEHSK